jgi:hypothetical protein
MIRRWPIFASLLLFLLAAPAPAWWDDGHVVVARIAETYLTPEARAGIKGLLDENREGERAISDVRICTWADLIRSSGELNEKYPKNDTWHYINIELKVTAAFYKPGVDGNDVVGAIERFQKVLKDPDAKKQDRKEALYFLVHFVGDLHQPLHCGNREDDRGGNLQPVKSVRGKAEDRLNLHKVWDGHIAAAARGDLSVDDFAKRLGEEIKTEDRMAWSKGSAKDWAWESHEVCVARVYKFTDGTDLPKRDAPAVELTDENYLKANVPFVLEQLKKGGVRLAAVLNECFAGK